MSDSAWHIWLAFFFITIGFYILGRKDEETNTYIGLIIFGLINFAILVWFVATAWATGR